MSVFITVIHCAVLALVIFAAYEDVRYMRIRNTIVLAVAALFIPMLFLLPVSEILAHLTAGAIVFAIGAAMFFARLFGGGDAKLIAAVALWPNLTQIPVFFLSMTVAGGVLALAALCLKRSPLLPKLAEKTADKSWFAALSRGETVVPYGVAIAIATAITLF